MANLILTWEKINSWGGVTYSSDLKKCPTKSEIIAKGLLIPYTASDNQLVYNVTRTVYSNITIESKSVKDIPASGGSRTSGTVTYSLTKTVYNYLTGTSTSTITSGASVSWNGYVTGSNLGTTVTPRTNLGNLTVTINMNGKSVSTLVPVYLQANNKTDEQNICISGFGSYLEGINYPDNVPEENYTWGVRFTGTYLSKSYRNLNGDILIGTTDALSGNLGANRCFDLTVNTVASYTSGSQVIEDPNYIVDGVTWEITSQSGTLPDCTLTVGYLNHNYDNPAELGYDRYAAHVYWLLYDPSLADEAYYSLSYFPSIGIDSLGDKLTKTVNISATYNGMTSTATLTFEAERVI